MTRKIKLNREWGCTPMGGAPVSFAPGTYSVPDQMSDFLADRCLRSGRGQLVQDDVKQGAPQNKKRNAAPENKSAA